MQDESYEPKEVYNSQPLVVTPEEKHPEPLNSENTEEEIVPSFPVELLMTKLTNKFVNMSKFIVKEFVKVYQESPEYDDYPELLGETERLIGSWKFGKGGNDANAKKEYTMGQLK